MRIKPTEPTTPRNELPSVERAGSAGPAVAAPADEIRFSRTQPIGGIELVPSVDAARFVADAAQKLITQAPLRALSAQGNAAPDDVRRLLG